MDRRGSSDWLLYAGICLLFVFCALVPSHYVYFYGGGWLGRIGSLLPVAPLGLAVLVVGLAAPGIREACRHYPQVATGVGLLLVAGLLGGIGSEVPVTALSREVYYFLTGAALGFAGVAGLPRRGGPAGFLWFVAVVSALVAGYGVFEFAIGSNPLYGRFYTPESPRYAGFAKAAVLFGNRIKGSVGHPGSFGVFLSLCLPIAVALALASRGGRRAGAWACSALIATGLMLTFTRGAWLGGFAAMLVFFSRYAVRHLLLAGIVVAVFAAGLLSVDKVWDTLKSRRTIAQLQNFERDPRGVAYLQVGEMAKAQPFLGVGTANYRYLATRFGDYDDTPDNMYLRVVAENGVAGATAFIGLFVVLLATLHRIEGRLQEVGRTHDARYVWAIFASVCGFATALILNDVLYFTLTRITFWLLVGTGLAMGRQKVEEG